MEKETNLPFISVVIPTYNHAGFLKRALTTVADQKYSNLEVIVVDNHSADHTDQVVSSFVDLKIILLKINNKGVIGKSRNYGMSKAKGEWIAFLDSDDLWYPTRLSSCLKYLESSNYQFDVISTDEIMVFNGRNKKKIIQHGPSSKNMYRDMLLYGNRLSPSATLVRKSFLDENNLKFSNSHEFVTAEDYEFWMQLARYKAAFFFINSVEGEYTIHENNASSQLEKHTSANKQVLFNHVFNLQKFELNKKKLWRNVRSRIYLSDGIKRLKAVQLCNAIILLFMSITISPLGFTALILTKFKLRKCKT